MYSTTKIHTDRIWDIRIYPPRDGKLMCWIRMDLKDYLGFINNPHHVQKLKDYNWFYHKVVQFKLTAIGYLDIDYLVENNP